MKQKETLDGLVDQLSNWGLAYLAGAMTEHIHRKGSFTEDDLRDVVEAAKATPMLVKVWVRREKSEPVELQHPGKWLPGDQVQGTYTWTRGDYRWTANVDGQGVARDKDVDVWVSSHHPIRITHLVPRSEVA